MKSLIEKQCSKNKDGLLASYHMAKLIAKTGKNYGIWESLIIPCIKEFIGTVMHQETDILKTLPLSDTTVKKRIEEMANDVEKKLVTILKKTSFSIQLDESTIVDNNALLMVYVRYADENNELQEEMLYAVNLITDTT
ncbi:DUF4371 domain-containing protein [Trichonephila clavata]|uniref:DUF4371 domain-containing protein n=1 Tax=Trichonephila clavata TaxID=2740835 RepID=A0A8X6KUG5_TRICU|nr:DUF4371 domain-containing protein [Trichonephila clavata]